MSSLYPPKVRGCTALLPGVPGLVPRAAAGDQDKQLHGDGTFRTSSSASAATNAQAALGTSTTTVLTPANAQFLTERSPKDYLQSDGATSNRRIETQYGTVGAVAGSDLTEVDYEAVMPTSNPAAGIYLWALCGSNSSAPVDQNNSLFFIINTDGSAQIRANGTTAVSDIRAFTYVGFRAAYSGRRVRITVAFTGGVTTAPVVHVDGVDISASFSGSTAGSAPDWVSASLVATYHLAGYNWAAGYFRPGRPVNRKYAQADVDFVQATGKLAYADAAGGSAVSLVTGDNSTFASDTGFWTMNSTTIAAGVATVANLANGFSSISKTALLVTGRRYRITFTLSNVTEGGLKARLGGSDGTVQTVNGTYTEEIICGVSNQTFALVAVNETSCDIDNVTVVPVGALSDPIIQPILVVADATANGIGSLVVGFAPVTSKKDWVIQAQTSLATNQQLLGGSVFAAVNKNRLNSWTVNCASGTPTVSLGNVSAGAQYDSATVLAAGMNEIALDTRYNATANLWCVSTTTAINTHTIHGHKVD